MDASELGKNAKKTPYIKYTKEIAEKICRLIATTSDGLGKICERNPDLPRRQTINEWRLDHPEFSEMYYAARQKQMNLIIEEVIDIADDTSKDTIVKEGRDGNPSEYQNAEWINRSRLRVDTRKWMATKLLPKIYGEKSEQKIEVSAHESWIDLLK